MFKIALILNQEMETEWSRNKVSNYFLCQISFISWSCDGGYTCRMVGIKHVSITFSLHSLSIYSEAFLGGITWRAGMYGQTDYFHFWDRSL